MASEQEEQNEDSVSLEEETKSIKRDDISTENLSTGKRKNCASIENDEEEKKAERRAANRRSAFKSRLRQKILIEELQKTASQLSKQGDELRNQLNELKAQLQIAELENQLLRSQQQSPSTIAAAAPCPMLVPQNLITQTVASAPTMANGVCGDVLGNTSGENPANPFTTAGLRLATSPRLYGADNPADHTTGQMLAAQNTANVGGVDGQMQQELTRLLTVIGEISNNVPGRATSELQSQRALLEAIIALSNVATYTDAARLP